MAWLLVTVFSPPGVEVGSAPPLAKVEMIPESPWLQNRPHTFSLLALGGARPSEARRIS